MPYRRYSQIITAYDPFPADRRIKQTSDGGSKDCAIRCQWKPMFYLQVQVFLSVQQEPSGKQSLCDDCAEIPRTIAVIKTRAAIPAMNHFFIVMPLVR
ncbi:MAG: hypothetical protein LBG73_00040 [Spirochaetaceae bacterium]|nr:hypothetical protein [Spirochaetaceae bacterium]